MPFFAQIRAAGWISSIGLHLGAAALLLSIPEAAPEAQRRPAVAFSIVTSAKAATPVQRTSLPNTPTQNLSRVRPPNTKPTPTRVTKEASPSKPLDMTGVTLTGGDGAAWSSMTGNGQAMLAPIVQTVAAASQTERTRHAPPSTERAPKQELRLVPVKDLSAKPLPPPLDTQLLSNYPSEARRLGLPGRAVVVARIDADGTVRTARVFTESAPGFGTACQKTLLGSRWSEPRDKEGRQVQTQIYYTCDFRVDG